MRSVRRVQGEGMALREFDERDVADLRAAFADPEIVRWNPGPTDDAGLGEWMAARNDWSDGAHVSWAIERDDRLAGAISLHHLDRTHANTEVGYWVAPWARRRGVAVAAVRAASSYAFTTLGLVRVFLFHAVENDASCRVATGAGMTLEGTLRQSFRYADGRHHDEHLHARLVTDPPPTTR